MRCRYRYLLKGVAKPGPDQVSPRPGNESFSRAEINSPLSLNDISCRSLGENLAALRELRKGRSRDPL